MRVFRPDLAVLPPESCALGAPPGSATEAWCFANHRPSAPTVPVIKELPANATISFNDLQVFSLLESKKLPNLVLSSPYDPGLSNPTCTQAWQPELVNTCRSNVGLVPFDQVNDIQSFCSKDSSLCYRCADGTVPLVPASLSTVTLDGKKFIPYICPSQSSMRPVLLNNAILVGDPDLSSDEWQPKNSDLRYRVDRVGDGKWFSQKTITTPSFTPGIPPRERPSPLMDENNTLIEKGFLKPGESKVIWLNVGDVISACSVVTGNCGTAKTGVTRYCNEGRQFVNMFHEPPATSCTFWGFEFSQINLRDYLVGIITATGGFTCQSGKMTCFNFQVSATRVGRPDGPPGDEQPPIPSILRSDSDRGCDICLPNLNHMNSTSPATRNDCFWSFSCNNLFPS